MTITDGLKVPLRCLLRAHIFALLPSYLTEINSALYIASQSVTRSLSLLNGFWEFVRIPRNSKCH